MRYKKLILILVTTLLATAVVLFFMGRNLICPCGTIQLWTANIFSLESSQHVSDWYSFSHIIHGFIFFWLLSLFAKKTFLQTKFYWALGVEVFWELLENTQWIINHYRSATISTEYNGDSVLNSIMDILFMTFGFYLAAKLPVWLSILLIIAMELGVLYFIRDNLTLNILMLIYPSSAIKQWQAQL